MSDKLFNRNWIAKAGVSLFTSAKRPSTEQRFYEPAENGYKLTVKGTNDDGTYYEWGYTAPRDGEPFPVKGREDVDSIIAHKVNEEITIGDFLKDGKIVAFYRRAVKADGNLTVVVGGVDNESRSYFDVIEYASE